MATAALMPSPSCILLKWIPLVAVVCAILGTGAAGAESVCHSSGVEPFVPFGLDLCYMHSRRACCLTGYDETYIRPAYIDLLPTGAGCRGGSQRIYASLYALRQFLCLPCDPKEPQYRFLSTEGDIAQGGVVPPSQNSQPGEFTWRVCRSFLYGKPGKQQGLWGDDGTRYDSCGVVVHSCPATPIFNIEAAEFSFPPTSCPAGTELIIPSVKMGDAPDPGVDLLLRVAQTMSDFQIVVVNDSDPNFDYRKTPCFGRSNAAGAYAKISLAAVVLALVLAETLVM